MTLLTPQFHIPTMTASSTTRIAFVLLFLLSQLISCCQLGKADVDAPYLDVGDRGSSGTSSSSSGNDEDDKSTSHHADDPAQIVARALLCFNDRKLYRSCDEDFRLNESGTLSVPLDQVDAYCGGPCFSETNLVLDCVEGIMENFVFYNSATIEDVKDTMKAGCSDGPDRGDFDVSEHLQASQSTVVNSASGVLFLSALVSAIAAAQAW
ncbi:hypothetical protein LINGRAHAP2_LOCUS6251 [Linum grandiflorum]